MKPDTQLEHSERVKRLLLNMIEINSSEEIPKPKITIMTMKLYHWALSYPNLYNLIKIVFGFLISLGPVLMFILLVKINFQDESLSHNFSSSVIPLLSATIVVFVGVITFIFVKLCGCMGRMICPPWDRELVGVIIQTIIVLIGIFFTIEELYQCMVYFDTIKNNLIKNFNDTPLVKSLLLTILFFEQSPPQEKIFDYPFLHNETIVTFKSFLKSKKFNFTKIMKPGKIYVSDLYSENIIYEFVLNIMFPIVFISFVSLFRILLFKTKNSLLKFILHVMVLVEYFVFKYSDCNRHYKYICLLSPLMIILVIYFFLKVYDLSESIAQNSQPDKNYFITMDTITILGIIFIGNSVAMCWKEFNYQGLLQIRKYLLFGVILVFLGNCLNLGDLFIEYYMFSYIKHEYLPVPLGPYYYESYMHYSKFEGSTVKSQKSSPRLFEGKERDLNDSSRQDFIGNSNIADVKKIQNNPDKSIQSPITFKIKRQHSNISLNVQHEDFTREVEPLPSPTTLEKLNATYDTI